VNARQPVREVIRIERLGIVLLATEGGDISVASEAQYSVQI
jgi:hypothetical protein